MYRVASSVYSLLLVIRLLLVPVLLSSKVHQQWREVEVVAFKKKKGSMSMLLPFLEEVHPNKHFALSDRDCCRLLVFTDLCWRA